MERIFRISPAQQQIGGSSVQKHAGYSTMEEFLIDKFDLIINVFVPVTWCLLFVVLMDRDAFISYLYIPFIGIFAAVLCNSVPIGGGVVYVPALSLLGTNLHLGVSFSVATMSFGNGVFGFLRWLHKDPSLIIWESFIYTVLPSSTGSFIAILFFPPMELGTVRTVFASFCLFLAAIVLLAIYRGGQMDRVLDTAAPVSFVSSTLPQDVNEDNEYTVTVEEQSPLKDEESAAESSCGEVDYTAATPKGSPNTSHSTTPPNFSNRGGQGETHFVSATNWGILALVSFLAGVLLVPNIGVGPALTTYLGLQLVGYAPKRAIVTGIIAGGWVSVVPFLLHLLWLNDVPLQLWIMVIPGVYYGAKVRPMNTCCCNTLNTAILINRFIYPIFINCFPSFSCKLLQVAPYVHDVIGLSNVLTMFAVFLLATSALFFQ